MPVEWLDNRISFVEASATTRTSELLEEATHGYTHAQPTAVTSQTHSNMGAIDEAMLYVVGECVSPFLCSQIFALPVPLRDVLRLTSRDARANPLCGSVHQLRQLGAVLVPGRWACGGTVLHQTIGNW